MNFQPSLEQEMLRESVAGVLDRVERPVTNAGDWRRALAPLGVYAILLPDTAGGAGLGMVEATLVAREAGYRAVCAPVSETMAALPVLADIAPDAAAAVLDGTESITFPLSGKVACIGGRLTGRIIVAHAGQADWLALAIGGGKAAVMRMPADGALRSPMDPDVATATIDLDADLHEGGLADCGDLHSRIGLLRAAELAGAARYCFDVSIQYLKDRSQFGRPIGANQALKHMAAENFVRVENMRVAVEYAACAADTMRRDPEAAAEAENAWRVMSAYVPETARKVAEDAIQMHGGIGATRDFPLNLYLRRILRLEACFGNNLSRQRMAAAILDDRVDDAASFESRLIKDLAS